ncbi:RagB/SusD family nutrient uptake outer membrane protein [Echinicola sp. CAU 1574]|uniref:RagB/SusD family nutrient uptake outer membrane protein n=1 Tax=Echinicola arenosa TaxID=2774144 RepID=A0ABR9APH6_9BACT|nr:RagB/SusD family nutrient uptake outer membrane protein [Echinicola arenosa]MBD8490695.1 RagB/SusD family nutrient uptake outer membrane protein [Echinicola arenosa]
MKKIYIFLLTILTLSLSSCNDWLELQPENNQVSDEYWANKEEVEAVLGAGYVRLRESMEQMLVWGEMRGNGLSMGFGTIDVDIYRINQWDIGPGNEFVKWDKFYQVINYANMVIKYGPTVVDKDPSFSENVMQSYLSEAYFLRGLAYFYLVRNFRDVPLITEPYMDDSQSFEKEKSPANEVYQQIKSDLEGALEYSKEIAPTIWETKGRSTKWAIYATLADVYLWTEEYDKSIAACDAVINSGQLGLLQGMMNNNNNWYTIFNPGNSNEGIFELQYEFDKNQTNSLVSWFGTNSRYVISENTAQLFQQEEEDIRGKGASYTEEDSKVWKYLGAEAGTGIPRTYSDQNWIIYRIADIYLMKAEALVMKGTNSYDEAVEIVNAIRERAQISAPVSSASTELEMLQLVMDERAREFVGEGKNWYDLLRVGSRNNYQYKDYLITQVLLTAPASSAPIIRSKLLDENSHYLPIHINELSANRLLVQNPYYDNLN